MRLRVVVLAVLVLRPADAFAEGQLKPFLGLTFGGGTTILDFEDAVGERNMAVGISAVWLGEIFGVEVDFGYAPGFFESDDSPPLVAHSGVTTLTGNVIVAMPRRWAQYTLRPYVVGGFGLMRVRIDDQLEREQVEEFLRSNLAAINVGGGVTGFLTPAVGVSWELRYFRNVAGSAPLGTLQVGAVPRLSFWRANMALTVRY